MSKPKLYKNGVTAAVDHITPSEPRANDYSPRLVITVCFDLQKDVINSIDSAVADPEIIIKEKPIPNWQTLFTTRRRQILKNDDSGEPLDRISIGSNVLHVVEMVVLCGGAIATGPTAPLALVAMTSALQPSAKLLFKLFEDKDEKQEDISREIKIQNYKWYSFRKWMKKPWILEQDLQVVLAKIGNHNKEPTPVEYEVTVRAETGQIAHRFFPVVIGTGNIKVDSNFKISWS